MRRWRWCRVEVEEEVVERQEEEEEKASAFWKLHACFHALKVSDRK